MKACLPLVFLSGLCVAAAIIPILKHWAPRLGVIAMPASDRWHRTPIPALGGASLIAAFLASGSIIAMPRWLGAGASVTFLVGLFDDLITMRPLSKLLATMAAAGLLAAGSWAVAGHTILPGMTAMVWIVVCIHCVNLLDHLDGLAGGVALISCLAISVIAIGAGQHQLAGWALALSGGLVGFLIYNSNPASIFMGDCGALLVGALLGVFSFKIALTSSESWPVGAMTAMFLMAAPLLDTSIVTVTRLARGIPISRGGRDHSSHRLVNLGLSERAAAYVLYLLEGLGAACAIVVTMLPGHTALCLMPWGLLFFALMGLFFMNLSFKGDSAPGRLYGSVPRLARAILDLGYRRRIVEFGLDLLVILCAFYGAYVIDHNFELSRPQLVRLTEELPTAIASTYCAFLLTGVHRGIWRYTGIEDALRFAFAALMSTGLMLSALRLQGSPLSASNAVVFLLLIFTLVLGSRTSFRVFLTALIYLAQPQRRVLIVGAGDRADMAARLLREQMVGLVGFVDEDLFKHNKLVRGSRVIGGIDELADIYSSNRFHEILMADDRLSAEGAAMVKEFAVTHGIAVQEFPWSSPEQPSTG